MCPDIETFAPLISATFGAGEVGPDDDELDDLPEELRPPDLRVRLADRSLRQTNPILGFVARLLELGDQRLTASQVLDLADRDPVRRRFGFDDDALARTQEWVSQTGIRWGLDAAHRKPFKLDKLDAGTWRAGLDRLLLGVAMTESEQRLFGGVLPLDDVESGAIDLAGRLAELIDRLHAAVDAMDGRAHGRAVGRGDRDRRRLADRHRPARRVAARGAAAAARRHRRRGARVRRGRDHARAGRGARAARRPPRRPPHPDQLPHRPPHDLHARADALGAAPRRLPARPRRRRVPAQGGPRRRRPRPARPARRRPRLAHRGPPDAARRADGGDRQADRHLHRQGRAHQHPAPARRPRRRAARRDQRTHGVRHLWCGPASAAAVRSAQLHAGRAGARAHLGLRPRDAAGRAGDRRAADRARAVPDRPAARARRAAGGARRARAFRRTPCTGVPAPAARDRARRLLRRARGRADGRARRARAVGRRDAAARGAARGRRHGRLRRGRDRARAAAARGARPPGHRAAAPDRRGDRRPAPRCPASRARSTSAPDGSAGRCPACTATCCARSRSRA